MKRRKDRLASDQQDGNNEASNAGLDGTVALESDDSNCGHAHETVSNAVTTFTAASWQP